MSRTAIAIDSIPAYGGAVQLTNASADGTASPNGNSFVNNGKTFLVVRNASVSPINVTIPSSTAPDRTFGQTLSLVTAVAASAIKVFGPFDVAVFNQTTGVVNVNFSDVTTVTVSAFTYLG